MRLRPRSRPGATGWGVIEVEGNRLRHVGDGVVQTDAAEPLAERLVHLAEGLEEVIARYHRRPRRRSRRPSSTATPPRP